MAHNPRNQVVEINILYTALEFNKPLTNTVDCKIAVWLGLSLCLVPARPIYWGVYVWPRRDIHVNIDGWYTS